MTVQTAVRPNFSVDDFALARIDYRAQRLAKTFRLTEDDTDDLRSEMTVELIKAGTRYDSALSSPHTFVIRTLDRFYRHLARRLRTRQNHETMCPTPISALPDLCPVVNDTRQGQASEAARVDLAIDLAEIERSLPPRLQRVCEVLRYYPLKQAAQRLGLHRSTLYRAITEIRGRFVAAGLGGTA